MSLLLLFHPRVEHPIEIDSVLELMGGGIATRRWFMGEAEQRWGYGVVSGRWRLDESYKRWTVLETRRTKWKF